MMRALVFDDDDGIREFVAMVLREMGFIVEEYDRPGSCPYGDAANCECTGRQVCADLIISDMQMPGMTGLQFIERQLNNGCRVRNIALMSANWMPEDYRRAKQLGVKIFHKPFDVNELTAWVESRIEEIEQSWIKSIAV
ncbi:response regulator [bacterium]|nr:response regulator [bacterium]